MSQRPSPELASTYVVQDRSNRAERERLQLQDALLTTGMGGVLAEQPDLSRFQHVLDVGCGTGGWLIELARIMPASAVLIGADISRTMVDFARAQAQSAQVGARLEFRTMDALRMLEFPEHFFDLVNQRAGASYVRIWEWPKLLQEYRRVTRVGGTLRITEMELVPQSSSPALTWLCELLIQALFQAGHLFAPQSQGITSELARLLDQHGIKQVQTRRWTLDYAAGTPLWKGFVEDVRIGFRTLLPFLQRWIRVPEQYEDYYQHALAEMTHPDFTATGHLLTAWGIVA